MRAITSVVQNLRRRNNVNFNRWFVIEFVFC